MLVFIFSGLVVLLDQFFKRWIVGTLELGDRMDLIPGVIGLWHTQNSGAAFGILAGQRWLLAAIAFVSCIILIFILLRYNEGFWGTLGLGAVLGGAAGNLIDRLWPGGGGYVVDMFETLFMQFAIFNIADIFIVLGFITFCIHFIIVSVRQDREEKEALEGDDEQYFDDDYDDQYDDRYVEYDEQYGGEYDDNGGQYNQPDTSEEFVNPFSDDYSDSDAPHVPPAPISSEPDLDEIALYIGEPQGVSAHSQADLSYSTPVVSTPLAQENTSTKISSTAWREYYEPVSEEKGDAQTLDALNSLESELSSDDYDVDALLREYGFENTDNK